MATGVIRINDQINIKIDNFGTNKIHCNSTVFKKNIPLSNQYWNEYSPKNVKSLFNNLLFIVFIKTTADMQKIETQIASVKSEKN